jgi:hypothetical protein
MVTMTKFFYLDEARAAIAAWYGECLYSPTSALMERERSRKVLSGVAS